MRGADGTFCPEVEHEPATAEGRAVAAALDRPGVWLRAGMDGTLAGLDLVQALASLPRRLDRDFARELFMAAELAFVAAHLKTRGGS